MKAPDKIYIQTNAGETISSKWTTIPFRDFENTEYIRKDALISFLEKEKNDLFNWHFQDEDRKFKVYEEVIDKIKEL